MAQSGEFDLTRALGEASNGDAAAQEQVVGAVYNQLHRVAAHILSGERRDGTLQTTALVNEAFLRLFGQNPIKVNDRNHFLNIAAQQMRRILIDRARSHHADKRKASVFPWRMPARFRSIGARN